MPMPRNDASRMKFEKYDSSRTCAGIQRMSATSRNRTRNDARKTLNGVDAGINSLVSRRRPRASSATSSGQPFHSATTVLPMYCRSAMPILLVQNPVAVRSRKLLKKATPCDELAASPSPATRCRRAPPCAAAAVHVEERLVEALSHSRSIQARPPRIGVCRAGLVDHHEVHELRHAGVGGAARPLVLRDDEVDEHAARSPTRAR